MSELRKIFDIRAFEFKLRNKFLSNRGEDKSTSISNNFTDFEVDLYLVIEYIGLVQLYRKDSKQLV